VQALSDMRIHVESDRHVRVAEPLLDDLRVLSGTQGKGCPCVPEIMEPDLRQAGPGRFDLECPRKPLGMQRAAIGPAEHETMIGEAGAHDQPLGQLLLAMPAELGDRARIQGDGTPAPGCLSGNRFGRHG
jgi:hypothetical protein